MALTRFLMQIVLAFLFYFVITPIGCLTRLFGRGFLDLTFKDDKKSYWISKKRRTE